MSRLVTLTNPGKIDGHGLRILRCCKDSVQTAVRIDQDHGGGMIDRIVFTRLMRRNMVHHAQLSGQPVQFLRGAGGTLEFFIKIRDILPQALRCVAFGIDGDHQVSGILVQTLLSQ